MDPAPAGGRMEPSMSPGSSAPTLVESRPVVTNVADVPASIAERLNANGCGPR
jgi:hypothetical protein